MIKGQVLYRLNGYLVVKEDNDLIIYIRYKRKKDSRRRKVLFNSVHHRKVNENFLLNADIKTFKTFSKLYKFINNYKNNE